MARLFLNTLYFVYIMPNLQHLHNNDNITVL
jgi:hypothetical protein